MTSKNTSGNPDENEEKKAQEKMDFEFIDESEIQSVKRGRKPIVIAELIAFMEKAKVGQTAKIGGFAIDSALYAELDSAYKNDDKEKAKEIVSEIKSRKATVSVTIRSHARYAGWKKVAIMWDTKGMPFAKRIA